MPSIRDVLTQTRVIDISLAGPKVEETVAREFQAAFNLNAEIRRSPETAAIPGSVRVGVITDRNARKSIHPALDEKDNWMMVRVKRAGGTEILAARPHLLYGLFWRLREEWGKEDADSMENGRILHATFQEMRPVYDLFLTQ